MRPGSELECRLTGGVQGGALYGPVPVTLCELDWWKQIAWGTNWTSEDQGGGREAGPTGTLFAGPLHLSAAARSSPALTVSTGLWVADQGPLIYGLSSLLLSELCWPKFCYWQKDEVLFVFRDLRAPPSALHHCTTRNGSLIFALVCLSLSVALNWFCFRTQGHQVSNTVQNCFLSSKSYKDVLKITHKRESLFIVWLYTWFLQHLVNVNFHTY